MNRERGGGPGGGAQNSDRYRAVVLNQCAVSCCRVYYQFLLFVQKDAILFFKTKFDISVPTKFVSHAKCQFNQRFTSSFRA